MAQKEQPGRHDHDDREIDARGILRLVAIIAVTTAGALGVAGLLNGWLAHIDDGKHALPPPIAVGAATAPVAPRLQPSPPEGLKALRAAEEERLTSYGWVDKPSGVVSIPIARAMEILSERPLPARASAPAERPVSQPTNSTLGEPRDPAP